MDRAEIDKIRQVIEQLLQRQIYELGWIKEKVIGEPKL